MKQKYFFWGKFSIGKPLNSARLVMRFFISYNLPYNLIKFNGKYDLVIDNQLFCTDLTNLYYLTGEHLLNIIEGIKKCQTNP